MSTKSQPPTLKAVPRPVRKVMRGAAETARLFIQVEEVTRRSNQAPLSRYVE